MPGRTDSELGQRLARRREEFGISSEIAAQWASLPADRIASMERTGQMEPWEFHRFCQALAINPGTLLQGLERSPRRSVARFRAAAGPSQTAAIDVRLLAVAAEVGRVLGSLAGMLSIPIAAQQLRQSVGVSDTESAWKQGYRLAEAARSRSGIIQGPIADLEKSLITLGIHVAHASFSSEDLDAASLWEPGAVPVILLNQKSPRVDYLLSRRAVLAHELCHLLHDVGEADVTTEITGGRRTDSAEQRARGFAPAFVAPRDSVRQWARTTVGKTNSRNLVRLLARHWGLSRDGAVWHAKNCGLITPRMADDLYRERGAAESRWISNFEGGRSGGVYLLLSLPDVIGEDVSPLWAGLGAEIVRRAYEAGTISAGRAREILSWH